MRTYRASKESSVYCYSKNLPRPAQAPNQMALYQVILEISAHRVHVVVEFSCQEAALDKYMQILNMNHGSPKTPTGKYTVRKKSTED